MKAAKSAPARKPWSCGFCGPGARGDPRMCHDTRGQCHGTWPGFVPRTKDNPNGAQTCACAAAGHHKVLAVIYRFEATDSEQQPDTADQPTTAAA